jgi:hypothetical protein
VYDCATEQGRNGGRGRRLVAEQKKRSTRQAGPDAAKERRPALDGEGASAVPGASGAPGAVCRPPPVRDPSLGYYGAVGSA